MSVNSSDTIQSQDQDSIRIARQARILSQRHDRLAKISSTLGVPFVQSDASLYTTPLIERVEREEVSPKTEFLPLPQIQKERPSSIQSPILPLVFSQLVWWLLLQFGVFGFHIDLGSFTVSLILVILTERSLTFIIRPQMSVFDLNAIWRDFLYQFVLFVITSKDG
jgi:hypothetical protein